MDPLSDPNRHLRGFHLLKQDRELVATQPSDGVAGAKVLIEASGDGDQELISDRVGEGVVDQLEPVEVDEQDSVLYRRSAQAPRKRDPRAGR